MLKKKVCKKTVTRKKKGDWSLFGIGKKKTAIGTATKRKKKQTAPRDYHRLNALDKLKKYYGGDNAKYRAAKRQFDKGYYGK